MEKDCDEHARGKRALIFQKEPGLKGRIYEKTEGRIDAWLAEGREERKREKKKGAITEVSEKRPKNQTSTPESITKRSQNQMVPKSIQTGPKAKPKQPRNQSNVFETTLDPSGGDFPALPS